MNNLDLKGLDCIDNYISSGLRRVRDKETLHWGYVDKNGNLVIECNYYSVGRFINGVARARTLDGQELELKAEDIWK